MNVNVLCFPAEDKASGKWRIMVMTRTTQGVNEDVRVMIAEAEFNNEAECRLAANVLQQNFMKAVQKV